MANIKISELSPVSPLSTSDQLPVVDVSAGATKKITIGEIIGIINGDVDVDNNGVATISELPVSKLQDGGARQLLQTDAAGTGVEWTDSIALPGTSTAASFIPSSSTVPTNGLYLSAANTVALATNSTGKLFVDPNGQVGIGKAVPLDDLHIASTTPAIVLDETDAGTDEKYWRIRAEGSILRFEGVNDAFNATTAWLNVTRSAGARTVDNIAFNTGTSERARIDSSGRLLVGTSSARSNFFGTTLSAVTQIEGTGGAAGRGSLSVINNDVSNNPPYILLGRSGAATLGSNAVVVSGSRLGTLTFHGADGTSFIEAATVAGEADDTPNTNDMPGRLVFSTTADGASSPTERMRIDSNGFAKHAGAIGRGAPVTKTGAFTVGIAENWLICNGTASITVTLPTASAWTGREIMLKTIAAFTVVSASSNVVPLAGGAAGTAILAATAGKFATLVSDGTNWIVMQAN